MFLQTEKFKNGLETVFPLEQAVKPSEKDVQFSRLTFEGVSAGNPLIASPELSKNALAGETSNSV